METNLAKFAIGNALEMMILFESTGKILYANAVAEGLLNYKESLTNVSMTEIFPMEAEKIKNLQNQELPLQEYMVYRGNRTCFPVRAKIVPYGETLDGYENVYLCMACDITMEKYLEKKTKQVEEHALSVAKVKTEFVANVTHELRTPVNGILGNVQELLKREQTKENLRCLQLMERSCKNMNHLINNILDFSKLESGKFSLDCRKFHFRNMIEYVKSNHNKRMLEKGLDFLITVSEDIPEYVIGDELRIVQILNNLISNGFKFTSVGGVRVEIIKTVQVEKRIELFFMVSDTGVGIDKEKQDKLFHSFTQLDASISRKFGGTGLGLNICKHLVNLMGGDIHLESQEGQGTNISFHIWVEGVEKKDVTDTVKEYNEEKLSMNRERELIDKLGKVINDRDTEKEEKMGQTLDTKKLEKVMSKLMLSVLMENWEKAELFADSIKQQLEEATEEVKRIAFRMKMAVQKEDCQKVEVYHEQLLRAMEDFDGNEE